MRACRSFPHRLDPPRHHGLPGIPGPRFYEAQNPVTHALHILAGWLIDGTGNAPRRHVLILVENGLILSGKEISHANAQDLKTSREVTVLDLSECVLVPGLVDSHVHLFMSGSSDPAVRRKQLQQPFDKVYKVISRHLSNHLSHGVLAVRDGGDARAHTLRYKGDFLTEKEDIFVKSPGRAWHARGRYGTLIGRSPPEKVSLAQSIAQSMDKTQKPLSPLPGEDPSACLRDSLDHVKIVNSGLNSLVRYAHETTPQFETEDLRKAVNTARTFGLRTMVHANGKIPVRRALDAGCDSIEHGFFMGIENLEIMADNQITWVPTACTMEAYARELSPQNPQARTAARNLEHQLEQLCHAIRLGVPVATGSDSGSLGVHHGTSLKDEIRLLMCAGFSLESALESATRKGARLLGLENELGLLVPGLPATFVAFKTTPRDLPDRLGAPCAVYIRGRNVSFPYVQEE